MHRVFEARTRQIEVFLWNFTAIPRFMDALFGFRMLLVEKQYVRVSSVEPFNKVIGTGEVLKFSSFSEFYGYRSIPLCEEKKKPFKAINSISAFLHSHKRMRNSYKIRCLYENISKFSSCPARDLRKISHKKKCLREEKISIFLNELYH